VSAETLNFLSVCNFLRVSRKALRILKTEKAVSKNHYKNFLKVRAGVRVGLRSVNFNVSRKLLSPSGKNVLQKKFAAQWKKFLSAVTANVQGFFSGGENMEN